MIFKGTVEFVILGLGHLCRVDFEVLDYSVPFLNMGFWCSGLEVQYRIKICMSALMIFPFNDCFFYYETGVRGPKTTFNNIFKSAWNIFK